MTELREPPVQLELSRRKVGRDDARADARELDREPPRPAAGVQGSVTSRDEPAQVVRVRRDRDRRRAPVFEPRPLALAVLVVERCGAGRVPAAHGEIVAASATGIVGGDHEEPELRALLERLELDLGAEPGAIESGPHILAVVRV